MKNLTKMKQVNELKIANDNRKSIAMPDPDNEQAVSKFEKQISSLEATQDLVMER